MEHSFQSNKGMLPYSQVDVLVPVLVLTSVLVPILALVLALVPARVLLQVCLGMLVQLQVCLPDCPRYRRHLFLMILLLEPNSQLATLATPCR
ncbi:unnamed protein product [Allacma fusca]|uniref:Uncharacterized protein n=1 Tax=Allacma fusca TaxID=39272 RepID=A0A8J2KZ74_9HEXA|nr:unnamed protein product [Allacma fusca]